MVGESVKLKNCKITRLQDLKIIKKFARKGEFFGS